MKKRILIISFVLLLAALVTQSKTAKAYSGKTPNTETIIIGNSLSGTCTGFSTCSTDDDAYRRINESLVVSPPTTGFRLSVRYQWTGLLSNQTWLYVEGNVVLASGTSDATAFEVGALDTAFSRFRYFGAIFPYPVSAGIATPSDQGVLYNLTPAMWNGGSPTIQIDDLDGLDAFSTILQLDQVIIFAMPSGTSGPAGASGHNSLIKITNESAGPNCTYGGKKIQSGVDTNNNGILDPSEVTATAFVCNGKPGTNGTNGINGTGFNRAWVIFILSSGVSLVVVYSAFRRKENP